MQIKSIKYKHHFFLRKVHTERAGARERERDKDDEKKQ